MKECINKGCREDVMQPQKSGTDRKGKDEDREEHEAFEDLWLDSRAH